jgi:transposase
MFPPTVEEYVPKDDAVRYVDCLVNSLDLSGIESKYSYEGRPAYHPAMLVKVLVYGKMRGIRSSRKLQEACIENVRFIYLSQNEKPDFRTISNFRKEFLNELGDLLKQTVRIGIQEGVIELEHVAIDGTKIRANAKRNSFKSREKLEEYLAALETSLKEDVELDQAEDEKHGDDDGGPKLPKSLQGKKELSERIQRALERQKKEKQKSRSTTDPDASFMKGPEGKHPSYNAQAAVDADSLMVVGADVSTAGSDHGQLKSMLEKIEEETGENPKTVSADKGYRATEGLVELEQRDITGFVPMQESDKGKYSQDHFLYDAEEDEYICPQGQLLSFAHEKRNADVYISENCSACSAKKQCLRGKAHSKSLKVSHNIGTIQRMRMRIETEEGKARLKQRAQTVELLFGWLKTHRQLRRFMFRGLDWVKQEWRFELAAVNIQRLVAIKMAENV